MTADTRKSIAGIVLVVCLVVLAYIAIYQLPATVLVPLMQLIASWQIGRWCAGFVNWTLKE